MKFMLRGVLGARPLLASLSAGVALALLLGQAPAEAAVVVSFARVTNNNTENLSSQLGLTIYGAADINPFNVTVTGNQVLMVLRNNVGIASNISEFYIDNGPILTGPTVYNSLSGFTSFTGGSANPGNLPGGNALVPSFDAAAMFSADVDSGNPNKGINAANDALGLMYTTSNPLTDIIADLADGDLRFGLHIRSIGARGGSDSYVSGGGLPPVEVPEPGSLALFGLALAGLAASRWRKQ